MEELHALSHLRNNQNKTKSLVSKCSVLINNNTLWYIKNLYKRNIYITDTYNVSCLDTSINVLMPWYNEQLFRVYISKHYTNFSFEQIYSTGCIKLRFGINGFFICLSRLKFKAVALTWLYFVSKRIPHWHIHSSIHSFSFIHSHFFIWFC